MDLSGHSLDISAPTIEPSLFPRSSGRSSPRFETPSISICLHLYACHRSSQSQKLLSPASWHFFPYLYCTITQVPSVLESRSLIDHISRTYHHQHRLSRRCMSSAVATAGTACVPFLAPSSTWGKCAHFPSQITWS
jgi:hypothetical protein